MKNSRKIDSPKRSIIDKPKKRLVNSYPQENENNIKTQKTAKNLESKPSNFLCANGV